MINKLKRFVNEFLGDAPSGMFIGETKLHGMAEMEMEPSLQPNKSDVPSECKCSRLEAIVDKQREEIKAIKHGLNSLAIETDILLKKFDK